MTTSNSDPLPPGMLDPARRTMRNTAINDEALIIKYGRETNYEYSLIDVVCGPGGGTPLHYHTTYAEHLTCTSGLLGMVLGSSTYKFTPGESGTVPIGMKHKWFNASDSEELRFQGKIKPAHEGFEKCLHIIYGLDADGETDDKGLPKSLVHLCITGVMGDMKWPGWMAWVGGNWIMRAVAAYGRWSGEEERLLKRYWG